MILAMLAALAAQPAVDAEVRRVTAAVPEAARLPELPAPTAAWLARLPNNEQRDVALLVLLSYGQAGGRKGPSTAANVLMGLAYAAAETIQNQDPSRYQPDRRIDSPVPMRAPMDSLRAERAARAQRAMAWGHRLGLCDATFVAALRALPAPAAPGEPDLRPVVRDLGMLAYSPDCTNASR
jgi:hypothetical protein